jgi:hypothetical protein
MPSPVHAPPVDRSHRVEIFRELRDGAEQAEEGRSCGLVCRCHNNERREQMECDECDEPRLGPPPALQEHDDEPHASCDIIAQACIPPRLRECECARARVRMCAARCSRASWLLCSCVVVVAAAVVVVVVHGEH